MIIELLFFDGCPHWIQARKLLSQVLRDKGLGDEVVLVKVTSNDEAQRLRFVGSPSIRVDGVDVEPDAPDDSYNMECRLYWIDGKAEGVPSRNWIESAVVASKDSMPEKQG